MYFESDASLTSSLKGNSRKRLCNIAGPGVKCGGKMSQQAGTKKGIC